MSKTDNQLKVVVRDFAPDFAAWLLDVKEDDVHHVQPLNIELPAEAVWSDTVFRVTLTDGRVTLLHIEFQGRRSERPMPLRMLDYLSRLAQQESGYLCSNGRTTVGSDRTRPTAGHSASAAYPRRRAG